MKECTRIKLRKQMNEEKGDVIENIRHVKYNPEEDNIAATEEFVECIGRKT